MNDSPVNNVSLLLFNNHYYPLTSLLEWYDLQYYCIECDVRYNSKHTCNPVRTCTICSEKNMSAPNGGKLLGINAKLIDSCCFIAMPLSRLSDTFSIPHTNGTFPHMFNVFDNYNYVGPLPALRYYDPNGMKNPLHTQLIEWHQTHENDVFDFAKRFMSTAKQTFSYPS